MNWRRCGLRTPWGVCDAMKIQLLIELDYDEGMMHSDDPDAKYWFVKEVLCGDLILFSNEIGDDVGSVKILSDSGDIQRAIDSKCSISRSS